MTDNTTTVSSATANVAEVTITYPETISELLADYMTDAKITSSVTFPAGFYVSAITYGGTSVPVSELDLGGKTSVYLSELTNEAVPSRNPITGHVGREDVWEVTFTTPASFSAEIQVDSLISKNDFVNIVNYGTTEFDVEITV